MVYRILCLSCRSQSGIQGVPRRPTISLPRKPDEIIDDQARCIERLEENLKRSELQRQRQRQRLRTNPRRRPSDLANMARHHRVLAPTNENRLKRELEIARRRANRRAAPFSRGLAEEHPEHPGGKLGAAYGGRRTDPFPAKSITRITRPCRLHAPTAAARSDTSASSRSISRTCRPGAAHVHLGPRAVALAVISTSSAACPLVASPATA